MARARACTHTKQKSTGGKVIVSFILIVETVQQGAIRPCLGLPRHGASVIPGMHKKLGTAQGLGRKSQADVTAELGKLYDALVTRLDGPLEPGIVNPCEIEHRVVARLSEALVAQDGRRLRQRQETKTLPIIMLTARGEESERIRGLATGADDYVVKPFSVAELMARVKALLRRANPAFAADTMEAGDLRLDRVTKRVHRSAREVKLGPTEFRLLECLMKSPGRVYGRDQLLDQVWGRDSEIDDRTVDVHVGRLRKALTSLDEQDPIRTVRGAGYAFDETFGRVA
jgi:two-component system phosphate regulon response regulator PhoB